MLQAKIALAHEIHRRRRPRSQAPIFPCYFVGACDFYLQQLCMTRRFFTTVLTTLLLVRKARMQATEISRERDTLTTQVVSLRQELAEAKNEVANVRRSIVEEKKSLERSLDEERRAKERARAQLDSRMDELQRRKSKFACL